MGEHNRPLTRIELAKELEKYSVAVGRHMGIVIHIVARTTGMPEGDMRLSELLKEYRTLIDTGTPRYAVALIDELISGFDWMGTGGSKLS